MPSQYDKISHLMRRAAFGARPNELQQKLSQGLEATVDELVNYEQVAEDPTIPALPSTSTGSTLIQALNIDDIATWWLTVMIRTKRPLRERMVHFWHDHFATSYEKVNNPNGSKHLYWQNELERQFATGNFRDLCKGMNRDAAMLRWLDSYTSRRTSPNENYSRELFEIFMLGLTAFDAGAYTEPDVQQAARAFTGWGWNMFRLDAPVDPNPNGPALTPAAVPIPIPPNVNDNSAAAREHDYTDKTVFGVTQNFNGDDIVDLVLDHEPQRTYAARMLGAKLFEHFAYEDPEDYVVDHMAAVLLRTNFNIKSTLRDLFLNVKEFYSDKAMHSLIKWPAYYMVSTLRLLGSTTINPRNANNSLRAMGEWLFWPPDVFGWPGREDWITTSQDFARANWANGICSTTNLPNANIDALRTLGSLGDTATPEQVVDYFTSLFVQRPLAPNVRQTLVDYLKKTNAGVIGNFSIVTDKNANYLKVRGLIHLFLARPEYQNH